jgi:hypothetical protein
MGIRVTGIVVAVALLLSSGVQAQTKASGAAQSKDKAEAKAHYDQGTVHYNLDEWPQAIEDFRSAYRLFPDATFLYNIAQCYRKAGNAAEALSFYKKYLRERPDAPNRGEVEKRIEELEASKASHPAPPVVPPPVAPASLPASPPVALAPLPASPEVAPPAAQPETSQPAAPAAHPAAATEPGASGIGSAAPPVAAASAPAGVDVSATAPAAEQPASGSIFGKWWFWTAVGVVVVAGGVGTFLALSGTKSAKHYQGDMDPPVLTVP